ncbi:MAG: ubiquitin-like domain-containing protein [Nakamurella sp.]
MSSSHANSEPDRDADVAAKRNTFDTVTIDWSVEERDLAEEIDSIKESGRCASSLVAARTAVTRGTRNAVDYVRRSPRKPFMIAAAIVVALVAGLAGTATAMAKTVTITVDGVSKNVTTLSGTVDGALASAGIKIGAHDSLAPSGRSNISDGSEISLDRGRTFTATVDGTKRTVWTTAATVSDALAEIGEQPSDLELSVPASAVIPLDGMAVSAATLHTVSLTVQPAVSATHAAVRAANPATGSVEPPTARMASAAKATTFAADQATAPAQPVEYTTSAQTVGEFLAEQGLNLAANQTVQPELGTPLADATAIRVATLPTVSLVVGTAKPATVHSDATTVASLLAAQGVALGSYDEVTPAAGSPVTDGMKVAVTKVDYRTTTKSVVIPQPADKQKSDATLAVGSKKTVTTGHPGEVTVSFHTKIENGVAGAPVEVSRKTVTEAVATVVGVGTKSAPVTAATGPSSSSSPTPIGANGVNWAGVAQCESGQRWNTNTGNGYYGGLQFDIRTWLGNGGGKYAPRADLATKEQQIAVANYVYAHRGLQPWGCRAYG